MLIEFISFFFAVDDNVDSTKSSDVDLKNDVSSKQNRRDVIHSGSMYRTITRTRNDFPNKQESKIPVLIKSRKREEEYNSKDELEIENDEDDIFIKKAIRKSSLSTLTSEMTIQGSANKRTRTAIELSKRVRSSGYGVSVNPKLRLMALKPKSASRPSTQNQRESSAKSKSGSNTAVSIPNLLRDNSRPIVTGKDDQRWEIIPSTIDEETHRTVQEPDTVRDSLEEEVPLSDRESAKVTKLTNRETARSDLVKIQEVLREESTSSDLLDQSVIQERLSSIKRKVEYRRRGIDSRSSMGSEFDAFMDR